VRAAVVRAAAQLTLDAVLTVSLDDDHGVPILH